RNLSLRFGIPCSDLARPRTTLRPESSPVSIAQPERSDGPRRLGEHVPHYLPALDERHGAVLRVEDRHVGVDAEEVVDRAEDVLGGDGALLRLAAHGVRLAD